MLDKIVEGRITSYIVNLGKVIDDYPLLMDATKIVEDAIRRDRKMKVSGHHDGYDPCAGPNYAIEHQRVVEYVDYISDKLTRDNYFKFDTRHYRLFLGSLPAKRTNKDVRNLSEQ